MWKRNVVFLVAVVTVGLGGAGVVVVAEGPKQDGPALAVKPDDPAPSVFLEIKPLNSDGVAAFYTTRSDLLRASTDDAPSIRLNKAKLRLAIRAIHYNFQIATSGRFEDGVVPGVGRAVRDAADAAGELWSAASDRRPWLEMLVGVQREVEQLAMARARAGAGAKLDAGPVLNRDVVTAQSARMDAELALLKLGPKK